MIKKGALKPIEVVSCWLIVPRRNEVAEGGYWITLRPSVSPSFRLE